MLDDLNPQSRHTKIYLVKNFSNKEKSLSCKCDKIQFEASVIPALLYSIAYLSHAYPSRPKKPKKKLRNV